MKKTDNTNLEKTTELCKKHIKKLGLKMRIVGTEYNAKERKLIFKFESDKRVDFRELLKTLQNEIAVKIELRQVGSRDKAKEVGGIGPCGEVCCCKRFLKDFDSVSVKLIKSQNLSCSPQKYTGYCGKLMCCLKFEVDNPKRNKTATSK
jgi:cell fate regulator YaaT (PSP1 superfamily)